MGFNRNARGAPSLRIPTVRGGQGRIGVDVAYEAWSAAMLFVAVVLALAAYEWVTR